MTGLLGARMREGALPGWAYAAVVVAGSGLTVFVIGWLSLWAAAAQDGIAAWWPASAPAAVAIAIVLSGRLPGWGAHRRWPLLVVTLLAVWVGGLVLRLNDGRFDVVAAAWALGDVVQAGVAGALLAGGGLRLRELSDLFRLLAAALIGAVTAGAAAVFAAPGATFDNSVPLLWSLAASRAAPILLLVPLVMRLSERRSRRGWVEVSAWWVLVTGTAAAVCAPGQLLPLAFLPMAVLIVAGLRLGPRTVLCQTMLSGVVMTLLSVRGSGPFAAAGPNPVPLAMVQTYLVVCALVVLILVLTVAQRDAALHALADQRQFDRAVLETVEAGVLACDADAQVVLGNAAYRRVRAVDDGATTGAWPKEGAIASERTPLRRALAGEELSDVQLRVGPAGAPPHQIVAAARRVTSEDGRLLGAVATFTDVTRERAVQARLQAAVTFQDAVLAATPDVILVTDVATHEVRWTSGTVEALLGFVPQEFLARERSPAQSLVHPDDRATLYAADDAGAALRDGEVHTVRVRMRNAAGEYRWLARRVTPFARDATGRVVQLLGVSRDVTDVVEVENRLAHAASHDPLTGLLNRRALGERLAIAMARAAESAAQVPVLFCDLDGFKAVNDSAGHAAGDALLVAVSRRIDGALREGDTLARVGGDEFVVLLEAPPRGRDPRDRTGDPASEALHQARAVAGRITTLLASPIDVLGRRHHISVSIGIALARPGRQPDQVLDDADTAMYRAKSAGRNQSHVYEVAPPGRGH